MRKELSAGFIASCVLITTGFLFAFHPIAYAVLSIFCAALLVAQIPFDILKKGFARKNQKIKILVDQSKKLGFKILELRIEVKTLNNRVEYERYIKNLAIIESEKHKNLYITLKKELADLHPDKKKGLFEKQNLLNLQTKYTEEGEVKA